MDMNINTVDFICSLSEPIGINELMHLAADSETVDENPSNPLIRSSYESATFYAPGKIFKDIKL